MARVKISERKGYTIWYDSYNRRFILCDPEGNDVGESKTQDAADAEADRLVKQLGKVSIQAIKVAPSNSFMGKVTSYDLGDNSMWFVRADKTALRSREKVRLDAYAHIYEATPYNLALVKETDDLRSKIEELQGEIESTNKQFEKRIDTSYFTS